MKYSDNLLKRQFNLMQGSTMILILLLPVIAIFSSFELKGMHAYNALSFVNSHQVHQATLVLSDHNYQPNPSSRIPDGLSFNVGYSNYHQARHRPLSSAEQFKLLQAELFKTDGKFDAYLSQMSSFKLEITQLANSLRIFATSENFGVQVRKALLDIQNKVPSDSMLCMYFNEALAELRPIIAYENGALKTSLSKSEVRHVNRVIDNFQGAADAWFKEHGKVTSAELVLSNSFNSRYRSKTDFDEVFADVKNSNSLDKLTHFRSLCNRGLYNQAYDLLQSCTSMVDKQVMQEIYDTKFNIDYTIHGIDRRFLADHKAKGLSEILEKTQLASIHNFELEARYKQEKTILQRCGIQDPLPTTKALVYRMIDKQEIGTYEAIDFITGAISSDHIDPNMQFTHKELCNANNGLPKHLEYSSEVATAPFDTRIHTAAYAQDRALLAKVGLINTKNPELKFQVERFVRYLQTGCSGSNNASSSRILAHELGGQLLGNGNDFLIGLPDLSLIAPNKFQDSLREAIIHFAADNVKSFSDGCIQGERIQTVMAKLGVLYQRTIAGDVHAEMHLEKTLQPKLSVGVLNINITQIAKIGGDAILVKRFNDYTTAIRDIEQRGPIDSALDHSVDARTGIYMHDVLGLRLTDFLGTKIANQLHHVIKQGILEDFKLASQLHYEGVRASHNNLFEVANKSNVLAHSFLQVRDYQSSINLSTMAHRALTFIQESMVKVGIGSLEGIAAGVGNVIHMAEHPWQSAYQLTASLVSVINYSLKGCETLLLDVPPSQMIPLGIEALNNAVDGIKKHVAEIGLRGVSKELSQFATEAVLLNEVGSLAGAASAAISEEVALLAREVSATQKAESLIAITAEGIEIKATAQASETAVLSEMQPINGSSAVPLEAINTVECPASCINQYEQLKNALRIEEITSVIKVTKHGLEQLIARGFSGQEIYELVKIPNFIKLQTDGAKAFIKDLGNGKYNFIVYNQETERVVTALRHINKNDLINLGKNYGWEF